MNDHEKYFACHELSGSYEIGSISPQVTTATLESMASELAREGNRPEGGRSELFRGHNLWEGGL